MQLYQHRMYPEKRVPLDIEILDFLTLESPSGIYIGNPVEKGVFAKRLCAINAGTHVSHIKRGIQIREKPYEAYHIDIQNKKIIYQQGIDLLGERDKIREKAVVECSITDIIDILISKGFNVE